MTTSPEHDARIAKMTFASVYPHYVSKVTKKGRTEDELNEVIEWLTGFSREELKNLIDQKVSFEAFFFAKATLHTIAQLITGMICVYLIEGIKTPLTQKVRYLDKIVDDLAKGRKMERILRTENQSKRQ